jgi:hypothetical protein
MEDADRSLESEDDMRISMIVFVMLAASVSSVAAGPPSAGPELPATISRANWQRAEGLLPVELLDKVKSGELEIRTQPTTDLPPSSAYMEATRRYAAKAHLRPDGTLEGYVAGIPFPEIDPADPQAGLKLAWNVRYHDTPDSAQAWGVFRVLDGTGKQIRFMEFYYAIAFGMHRSDAKEDLWAGDGVYFKELYQVLAPEDVKNQMNLKLRYDDDRIPDLNFAYVPETKRVRQVSIDPRERMMSSELLNEDFYGFWGYLHEYDWRFLGRTTLLAPVAVRAPTPSFELHHGYPTDAWELRKILVLEGVPKVPNHPYAKRVLYVDEQMGVPLYVFAYDHQGNFKSIITMYGNPAFSPGNEHVRAPLWYGQTVINHANGDAAVTVMNRVVVDAHVSDKLFTTSQLVLLAR